MKPRRPVALFFLILFVYVGPLFAQVPSRLFWVVPVYRELENQNLALLLSSLAKQNPTNPPVNLDVVWVVNNTEGVEASIREENKRTVKILNEISEGRVPELGPGDALLKRAAEEIVKTRIKFHVVDHTTPGFKEQNIGQVRDIGNQHALSLIPEAERSNTIIAQMDADTQIPTNYVERLQHEYSDPKKTFVLLSFNFGYEGAQSPIVYQALARTHLQNAQSNLYLASKGTLPRSGPPRITARASLMKDVNGIAHVNSKEGDLLMKSLKEHSPTGGFYLSDIAVSPADRTRKDSYDSAAYGRQLRNPNFLRDDNTYENAESQFNQEMEKLKIKNLDKLQEYSERLADALRGKEKEITERKDSLRRIIEYYKTHNELPSLKEEKDLFFHNDWLAGTIKSWSQSTPDSEQLLHKITHNFSHLFGIPLTRENVLAAKITALAITINPNSLPRAQASVLKLRPHDSRHDSSCRGALE
ncbi:MAG: hypothetical protein R3A80_00670 [Bdellovibrionota bacterium]